MTKRDAASWVVIWAIMATVIYLALNAITD